MQIQIRAAMARDYEAAVKILSQVQDMHVEWRPDIYRHTSHLMSMEEFQQAAEDHTFFVAENEKNQVLGILQIMFKHVEGPSHTTRDLIFVDRMAVDGSAMDLPLWLLFTRKPCFLWFQQLQIDGFFCKAVFSIHFIRRRIFCVDLQLNGVHIFFRL